MRFTLTLMLITMLCGDVLAQSFGVVGEVFPVAEKSFLVLIEERLRVLVASGELETLNQRWVNTVAKHVNRPAALGLERTNHTNRHDYVPEITLSQDMADGSGRVLYPKGTHVNALERMPTYKPCWLFFNADDAAQIHWAKKQSHGCVNPKFILTGGAINRTEQRLQSVIYFDQAGKITTKLHIAHVPAKIVREGNKLVIVELAIKENGDVL